MQWGKQQKLANDAIAAGKLNAAVALFRRDRFRDTRTGHLVASRLTKALVQRAENATSNGNLHQAWEDLTLATAIALPQAADALSRRKHQLVELTVEVAEAHLANAKTTHALRTIDELTSRQILDWRADRVAKAAKLLQAADESEASGQLENSIKQLEQVKELYPQLDFVESRRAANRHRQMQVRDLTSELQDKTMKGDWADVKLCCQKLLAIAPKYKVALDAQKHCLAQMHRTTYIGSRLTHASTSSDSFYQINGRRPGNQECEASAEDRRAVANTFLLWVDGVGGFLVCTAERNIIGQALPQAEISIPVLGDLRRRHARLETIDGRHLMQFLGSERSEGFEVDQPLALRCGQTVGLDGGVKLKYSQTHPLSSTARIDFVSRHRTQPWSDAILLAGQSIVLGPNRNNHVHCPWWNNDLILFHRNQKWFTRTKGKFVIDGREVDSEGPIELNSTICGEDFSLTLEPAFAKTEPSPS